MPGPGRRWLPGQSGNPKGTVKSWSLTAAMREFLATKDPETKALRKDELVKKTYEMAQKGDIAAIKLLWNYIDGMPVTPIQLDGEVKHYFEIKIPQELPVNQMALDADMES